MPRVLLAAVPLLAGLFPLTAAALGLGEINLRSALNQPLVAEIPITLDSADDVNQLEVRLASAETFERFGLDRPQFLNDLSFQIQQDGLRTVVRVTSAQPVSEPFVSLLLDVVWPQGRLLREYTMLIDPPAFAREDAPRQVAAPPVAVGPAAVPTQIQRPPSPAPTERPVVREQAAPRPVDTVPAASAQLSSGPDGNTYGPVRANETLWAISDRLRPDNSVSLNKVMVAIYRANPEAFAGNINRLKRGAILRVPDAAELASLSGGEAAAEVRRQNDEWRGAAATAPAPARLQLVPPAERPAPVPGPAAPTPAGPAPAPVPAPSPADASKVGALERELAETRRLLSLKDSELKTLQDRVGAMEGAPPATPVPAAEAPVERLPTEEVAPEPAVEPVVEPVAPSAETAAAQKPEPARRPATRPAGERSARDGGGSWLDSLGALIFNAWFLVSAAAVLLATLFVFARRRMATADDSTGRFASVPRGSALGGAAGVTTARRDGFIVEEGDSDRTVSTPILGRGPAESRVPSGDAETPLERTISTEGAVELDQADVVAEADFHMAYGLYDQAAELLGRALRDSPDRRDLRLKLLEVFFIWENKSAFLKEAQIFQTQLKGAADPDWNKVVIMGKQICPDEPLFAGAVGSTAASGLDLTLADEEQGGVDFAFDEGGDDALDLDLTGARKGPASNLLDFDLGEIGGTDDTGMTNTEVATGVRTTEVPTVEARFAGTDFSPTMETPTIESRGLDTPTVETPTIETPAAGTLETPTLESAVSGLRTGGAADGRRVADGPDQTEEINLEDLGLDLTGLDEAAGELGTGLHTELEGGDRGPGGDDFVIGESDDEASDLLHGLEGDATAEMRGMGLDEGTLDLPAFGTALEKSAAARDLTAETQQQRTVEDTAEQPRVSKLAGGSLGEESGELSQVDFDLGEGAADDLEPTSVLMPSGRRGPEGPTMTEVGTKLDLARAYVDMGDPEGARSILNEVLEEGDSGQRQEARKLLDDLAG